MALAQDVRRNTEAIAEMKSGCREITSTTFERLQTIQDDVKSLLVMNGTRQGQIGELRGRLMVICALAVSAIAGIASIGTLIWTMTRNHGP